MKKFIPFILVFLFATTAAAQSQYEVLVERPREKSLKGIITRSVLESDTSFKWFATNFKAYSPRQDAMEALKKNADSIQLLVFMGTWCEDSHFIIPKLYALTDAAGFSQEHITLIGTDRNKKTLSNLTDALNIKNIPTITVFRTGKESGRIVEYSALNFAAVIFIGDLLFVTMVMIPWSQINNKPHKRSLFLSISPKSAFCPGEMTVTISTLAN